MGEIRAKLRLEGAIATVEVDALCDTGAGRNFIRHTLDSGQEVDQVGISTWRRKVQIRLANGARIEGPEVRFPRMRVLGREVVDAPFIVLPDSPFEAILGHRTMQDLDAVLHPSRHLILPSTSTNRSSTR